MSMEIMQLNEEEFFSPMPTSSFPVPEDRTQPFMIHSGESIQVSTIKYSQKYIRATKWIAVLVLGYIMNRILVTLAGIPADAQHHTWLGHARNVADMVLLGFMQCWYTDLLDNQSRWDYLLKDWYFITLFLASNISFSILSSLPGFDFSFSEDSNGSYIFFGTLFIVSVWVCYAVGWHIIYSRKVISSFKDFTAYWLFRTGTILVLGLTYFIVHSEDDQSGAANAGPAKLHMHHYFCAWLMSLIGSFNHRFSVGMLAITAGIFVQGISIYSAASMFYRGTETPCPEEVKKFY